MSAPEIPRERLPLAASLEDISARAARTRVICLGLSALDQVWSVDKLLSGGSEKVRSLEYYTTGGGMAANAAVTVARLGGRAAFWGRAGNDAAGKEMRQALAAEGVDVSQFRLFPEGSSSVSGILVDGTGERQIVNFRGRFPEDSGWLVLDEVRAASAVLADPRWVSGAVSLFQAAKAGGVATVLDADVADSEVFEKLLPLTDHAIFSEPALRGFGGTEITKALAKVAQFGCRVAAVTLGAEGVRWLSDNVMSAQRPDAVEVVDTTGAGDVFHGAYALAIGAGKPVVEAMSFASLAAAVKCTRQGGRIAIPTLEDCFEFRRTRL